MRILCEGVRDIVLEGGGGGGVVDGFEAVEEAFWWDGGDGGGELVAIEGLEGLVAVAGEDVHLGGGTRVLKRQW